MAAESLYSQGFVRVGAAAPVVHPADPKANAEEVIRLAKEADERRVGILTFPALTLTGVSMGDLQRQALLQKAVEEQLAAIAEASAELFPLLVIGAPLTVAGKLCSCSVYVHRGEILGAVPEQHPGPLTVFAAPPETSTYRLPSGVQVPFGEVVVRFADHPHLTVGAVIGNDLDLPGGLRPVEATIVAALSAAPAWAGSARSRSRREAAHAEAGRPAVAYAAPSWGESTNDFTWDGQTLIAELGEVLAAGPLRQRTPVLTVADVDVEAIRQSRGPGYPSGVSAQTQVVQTSLGDPDPVELERNIPRFPLHVADPEEVLELQSDSIARRVAAVGESKLILGVSGGLDSTLALLVAVRAMESLGRPATEVLGYTMPGFGTSTSSRANAETLCRALGVTFAALDIRPAAHAMLEALEHPAATGADVYDVTFENVQAGLRTDYLFRLANAKGGMVVGTGDMSELALGWCTYGVGDQMSHYDVNAGAPKTLIQQILRWAASGDTYPAEVREVLRTILDAEISPELIPAGADGVGQSTEGTIGPYELHDFTLNYLLRFGFGPRKIAYLSRQAWGEKYSPEALLKWLRVFYRRFFQNQFKREAAPNAPRLLEAGSLSPRDGWRMPSDAAGTAWLQELSELEAELGAASRN